jgi:hypothetical protein
LRSVSVLLVSSVMVPMPSLPLCQATHRLSKPYEKDTQAERGRFILTDCSRPMAIQEANIEVPP